MDFNALPVNNQNVGHGFTGQATLQLKMQLKGQYQSFKDFLRALETNIRIIDLANLTVAPDDKGQNFTFNLVANTYYQP